jgi:hypothetical protein
MTIKEKKLLFEQKKKIYDSALLTFEGAEGFDVYNCSLPFTGTDGKKYMYGRVEDPREWASSMVLLFEETGKDTYSRVPDSVTYQLEDPFLQRIHGELILGGTHVRKSRGEVETYYGYFYRGDEKRMTYFTTGPDYMKDIRLVELANGRIGVFSRPRRGTYEGGAMSQIGFTVIDKIDELDAQVIGEAPYLKGLLGDGEWGGVNQAYLLESGKIGVIGHMSYEDADESGSLLQVYVNTAFVLDPDTVTATDPVIIGTKSCYPAQTPKRPFLADCCFTTGIIPREDGLVDLYSGVGDTGEGRITIDNPFPGEGKIICLL